MSEEQKLGVNLQWVLEDVGCCDNFDYLDSGIAEVAVAEDGFAQVEIIPMIAEAAERIQELEKQLKHRHEDYKIQVNAIADLQDKLAESVLKSEIRKNLEQAKKVDDCGFLSLEKLNDVFEKLLTPPAKEAK